MGSVLQVALTVLFEDTEDFATSDTADLGHTVGIPQVNTYLRGSSTLLGELANQLLNLNKFTVL